MEKVKTVFEIEDYCEECPYIEPEVLQPNTITKKRLIVCKNRQFCKNVSKTIEENWGLKNKKGGKKNGNPATT